MKQKCILMRLAAILLFFGLTLSGCTDEEYKEGIVEKTLFMYFPWSGNANPLTDAFYKNVADMEKAIMEDGLDSKRVIVFFATSSSEAEMYEIVYKNGKCAHEILKEYTDHPYTTASGLTSILKDVKDFAPAYNYAMTIGCHGMGWIQAEQTRMYKSSDFKYHWEYEGALTRWFGGSFYQTNITTLAEAIMNADVHMQFILFDDCYMANVEVAYDLRNVTNYLIASTCEVMSAGMPYAMIGGDLLDREPDYQAICDDFYAFYSNYGNYSYGTLSVIDCSQMDMMAEIMNTININYTLDPRLLGHIQKLDGYNPVIFYDFGDYVEKLGIDENLHYDFEQQLKRTVVYSVHTEQYYAYGAGAFDINSYSGLTISDPSISSIAAEKENTAWYQATH